MISSRIAAALLFFTIVCNHLHAQIDTTLLYNESTSFGPLDIRIARSANEFYSLHENKTYAFRKVNGMSTGSFLDMTAWNSDAYEQGNMQLSAKGVLKFVMNYRILKPANYKDDYANGYPLVIVLHGQQERGNCAGNNCYHGTTSYSPNENKPEAPTTADSKLLNNDYNLVHGGSNYLEAFKENGNHLPGDVSLPARAFPGFVVFPQNLNGWDEAAAEDAIRLVRLLMKQYNIDPNRVYINGVSNGGHGAYEVMKRAPWMFAAGVLFSAADDASVTTEDHETIIAGIPLWVFQGGVDKNPTQKETEGYVKQLRSAGANVRMTLYPQLGHGTWNKAFAEPDFFSWMLRQRKNNIHVFADNAVICTTNGQGATLSLPPGYAEYEWTFNGQAIEGEHKSEIIVKMKGDYRGRYKFTGNNWNQWSEVVSVTEKTLPPASIEQTGTTLLKDPNHNNEAQLSSSATFAHYYWFKNGTLLNLPGQEDDTLQQVQLKSSYGDGVYTLRVADYDNCVSPPSAEKHVYFSDRAPVNLATPEQLVVQAAGASETSLSWKHDADNSISYEVWRRKTGAPADSTWSMSVLTNEQSYRNKDLQPSASYEYMVRAVSNSGRSLYCAAVAVQTLPDNTPPSSPANLVAEMTGADKVKLHWNSSADNSAVKQYIIIIDSVAVNTNSGDTTYIINDISINKQYTFSVKAEDVGGNVSAASNTASLYTHVSGLFYQHSTGDWSSLDEIDWSIAEFTGVVSHFTLAPKTQEDFFNFRFDGYLNIVKEGIYQFRISSDDGSRLSLNDTLLIVNDGVHNMATVTAPIQLLSSGPQRITADFFDSILSDSLVVEYKGPDSNGEWMVIPAEALASDLVTSVQEPAASLLFDFDIYPNPSQDGNFTIRLSERSAGAVSISMYATSGQLIFQELVGEDDTQSSFTISKPFIQNGLYLIRLAQGKDMLTKRFVIDRSK